MYAENNLFNIIFLTFQSAKIVKELRAKQQMSAGPSDIEVMTIYTECKPGSHVHKCTRNMYCYG